MNPAIELLELPIPPETPDAIRAALGRHFAVAATKIPGQLFDWGKSNQCLNELFEDLATLPG